MCTQNCLSRVVDFPLRPTPGFHRKPTHGARLVTVSPEFVSVSNRAQWPSNPYHTQYSVDVLAPFARKHANARTTIVGHGEQWYRVSRRGGEGVREVGEWLFLSVQKGKKRGEKK